jgi:hypothetical protein
MRSKKRQKHLIQVGFQEGNVPHNRGHMKEAIPGDATPIPGYIRLSKNKHNIVCREKTELVREQEAQANAPKLLRPRSCCETVLEKAQVPQSKHAEMDTYRLLHLRKTANLWNEAIQQHRSSHPKCMGSFTWDEKGEIQRGLAWRERLMCDSCSYVSQRHKLYTEVETNQRGSKRATCNYGVQVGLAHTAISNTGLAKVLLASNTPAPSLSSMQASANTVGKTLVSTNEQSMANIRKDLRNINRLRGLPESTPVDIEMDCRYNNPIYSGIGKTPFQAATQVTQLVVENSTSKKQVIAITNKNKLCQTCAISNTKQNLSSRKIKSRTSKQCTDGDDSNKHVCSANIPIEQTIGDERKWATTSLLQLENDGIIPNYVTTDPDSKAFLAAEDVFLSGPTAIHPPKHQLDTRHVTSNQRKLAKNTKFSDSMFPGRTKEIRSRNQGKFSIDISTRCHAEHKAALQRNGGDTGKTLIKLYTTKSAIVQCYTGDHSLCKLHSYVCDGSESNNWMVNSAYLPSDFIIMPNTNDHVTLMNVIDYRLGPKVLPKMRYMLNTQKAEAVNRAVNACVPRNTTYARNFPGRVHAAVNAVNNGVGESIITSCAATHASLTPGTRVTRGLMALQHTNNKRKQYITSKKIQKARKVKKTKLFALHHKLKQTITSKNTYRKAICMPLPYDEHSYSNKFTER